MVILQKKFHRLLFSFLSRVCQVKCVSFRNILGEGNLPVPILEYFLALIHYLEAITCQKLILNRRKYFLSRFMIIGYKFWSIYIV